jgi:hypothetical protein
VMAGEGGLERLQMIQHGPEELLGHFRIAGAIGVRECIFCRAALPRARPRADRSADARRHTHH